MQISYQKYLFLALSTIVFFSCKTTKDADLKSDIDTVYTEPVVITPAFEGYRETAEKDFDLIDTRLEVSFDYEHQYLNGKAQLTLKPWFYPTNVLVLDAKGFDIHKVALMLGDGMQDLEYDYQDNKQLHVNLPTIFTRNDTIKVFIDYTAKPNELEAGGSAAITSDKGLYFINPLGKEPGKPRQIWTQGETESSSCWFPTIDKPNQKTTEEIFMTVDSQYVTLSNGLLLDSKNNGDGTRTDHWKQKLPHAPYLFMMAVGDFYVADTNWRGMPMQYMVEPAYKNDVQAIFGNTPEMIEFFSNRLGYKYAWEKYSQVIARDYVSGAMENTTANLYFSALQRTSKEVLDYNYEYVISHELFHQWFGDLLTCESWSNLPLNESFANYGEYLWGEYKYGKYEAEYHRLGEAAGYFAEAKRDEKTLIRFYYDDKEDMFDAHSYNKGGLILNMLRDYLGDDAFFAGLQLYLKENEFQPVEYTNLRLALEEVSGQDLNWFFNQWFLKPGHPELDIQSKFNADQKILLVTLEQTQKEDDVPIFRIPMYIDIYVNGKVQREHVVMEKQKQTFRFEVPQQPDLVNVDANKTLLAVKTDHKSMAEWIFMYNNAPLFMDKIEALKALLEDYPDEHDAREVFFKALEHPFYGIREFMVQRFPVDEKQDDYKRVQGFLIKIARDDSVHSVATEAVYRLSEMEDADLMPTFEHIIKENRSYTGVSAALDAVADLDEDKAYDLAEPFRSSNNSELVGSLTAIFAKRGDKADMPYYERVIPASIGYTKYATIVNYGDFLEPQDPQFIRQAIPTLTAFAYYGGPWWDRYAATSVIYNIKEALNDRMGDLRDTETNSTLLDKQLKPLQDLATELEDLLQKIKDAEKDEALRKRYRRFD